jgi:hypothetical protein
VSGRAATICDGNLQTRFHRFFGAWAELADECGASELSKADILQITGADKPGDARAVWRYLNELAKSERLPRVRPTGTGRAARWQLVR